MTIEYEKLKSHPRLLMEAKLKPFQGHRFQPTGFADLGPARYTLPDGTEMLLVESVQSVANRMELACWDPANDNLIDKLTGLPYIQVDCGALGKTNTINEFHRLNSPYIWSGEETEKTKKFREAFVTDIGLSKEVLKKKRKGSQAESGDGESVPGILDFHKFYKAVFKYDTNAVVHGLFLEKVAGRLRMPRILSGFIEASDVRPAENGGTKVDQVLPSPGAIGLNADEGYGNVPFHRTEFVAKEINAYFNLDLALLRGYGLAIEEEAKQLDEWRKKEDKKRSDPPFVFSTPAKLLIALALFKIRRFLSTGLRLRTACDLELDGDLTVTRPKDGFAIPPEDALLDECKELIGKCKPLFADPAITEVEWRQKEKPVAVDLPAGTREPTIPDDLKEQIEWKRGSGKKPPVLKFKKSLTEELAEKVKALFQDDEEVAKAIDERLRKEQTDSDEDKKETDNNEDDQS